MADKIYVEEINCDVIPVYYFPIGSFLPIAHPGLPYSAPGLFGHYH